MKKIFSLTLIASVFYVSCKQDLEKPADWTSVAIIHASPVSSTNPSDTLHVFVDGTRYNSTGILYNTNSTYIPIVAGSKTFDIRRGTASTSSGDYTKYVNSFSYTLQTGGAYSFFVYDTTTTSSASDAKVLRLKDDLTLPGSVNSKVRFLHLAPKAAPVDVTLLRTSVTPNDSLTITNKSYVGSSPNEETLSLFIAVPRGTYTAKVKNAGTQTVLTSATVTLTNGADVTQGRIVTIYITGTAKGRPLAIGQFRHY
jgi:hypothetical protein